MSLDFSFIRLQPRVFAPSLRMISFIVNLMVSAQRDRFTVKEENLESLFRSSSGKIHPGRETGNTMLQVFTWEKPTNQSKCA